MYESGTGNFFEGRAKTRSGVVDKRRKGLSGYQILLVGGGGLGMTAS